MSKLSAPRVSPLIFALAESIFTAGSTVTPPPRRQARKLRSGVSAERRHLESSKIMRRSAETPLRTAERRHPKKFAAVCRRAATPIQKSKN